MAVQGKYLILGNWKMHLTVASATQLATQLSQHRFSSKVAVGIAPAFVHIPAVMSAVKNSDLHVGGQNCHAAKEGAHTGDVAAPMLADAGCDFVIIGHSERRHNHGETSGQVKQKTQAALEAGLHVVLCVGETLAQRESGQCFAAVKEQLQHSLPDAFGRDALTIAYEPVWAIGSGKTATTDDIVQMHTHIRSTVQEQMAQAPMLRILYGGSVKANNALDILSLPVVDGVLVGGASLDPQAFGDIIKAAEISAQKR